MTKKKKITLLIDGDIVVYQVCFGKEQDTRWSEDLHILHSSFEDCKEGAINFINYLKDKLKATDIILSFSPSRCFRNDLNDGYKENRGDTRKPLALPRLRKWMTEEYTTVEVDNIECDDALGIMATGDKIKGRKIICSKDKDFMQIPGEYYNTLHQELRKISVEEADLYFYRQTLIGDAVDNYPGCPGYGPKTAEKVITKGMTEKEMWEAVVSAYKSKKLTENDALLQARMARILRAEDYDSTKGEVILWEPKT